MSHPQFNFEIGRHTFIDVGPPNDFYELFLVRPTDAGTSVTRITLTPAGDSCIQRAKVEVAEGLLHESVSTLPGKTDPCAISERDLHREMKRCKKCLVFSGANVVLQLQCKGQPRIIRADILGKDMFDPAPNTPEHTSWTMQLLSRLDQAIGPGVMDRPVFPIPGETPESTAIHDSVALVDVGTGKYDALFPGAPDKPSDLYRMAQVTLPAPAVQLVESTPVQPQVFVPPVYPPLARLAHVEGNVTFTLQIGDSGSATNFAVESGSPLLRGTVENAVASWKFPKDSAGQRVHATIEFKTNCPARR